MLKNWLAFGRSRIQSWNSVQCVVSFVSLLLFSLSPSSVALFSFAIVDEHCDVYCILTKELKCTALTAVCN